MENNKIDNFVDWLIGNKVEFPYFKNIQEVKPPEPEPKRFWNGLSEKEAVAFSK